MINLSETQLAKATLGGGCFWCLETIFANLKGVEKIIPGYAGGTVRDPTYEQVCQGTTNHAEVIRIEFNSGVISYPELLDVFFSIHDPTTLNRQGDDIGTQYRSVIFFHDQQQHAQAQAAVERHQDLWEKPIITEITPLTSFYPAEEYHNRYYERNPNQAYCRMVINPKVGKFKEQFKEKLKLQG